MNVRCSEKLEVFIIYSFIKFKFQIYYSIVWVIYFVFYLFKFEKPGSRDDFDYPDMAEESVKAALKDGGVSYQDIQQAYVGYVYGESVLISNNLKENYFSKCIR